MYTLRNKLSTLSILPELQLNSGTLYINSSPKPQGFVPLPLHNGSSITLSFILLYFILPFYYNSRNLAEGCLRYMLSFYSNSKILVDNYLAIILGIITAICLVSFVINLELFFNYCLPIIVSFTILIIVFNYPPKLVIDILVVRIAILLTSGLFIVVPGLLFAFFL